MSKELNKAPVEQAGTNVGHGHVFPRADGVKMRCGGPGLCSECAADAYRARAALAQPSPGQAEAERPEVVGYRVSMPDEPELGHWLEEEAESEPQIQHHEPLMTVAQHERIVEALRFERQQMDRAFTACINERDAANARLHEVATACATAEQERDAALDKISKLESRWPHGESPEERFEHYISNTIDRAPEPLRRLGNWLSHVLDEDQWTTAERMLTGACVAAEERAAEQTQHSVPEEFSFEYRHPNGECHTVTVSREQVINEMPDFLFEALCSKFCNCEPVGETNVVECCCDEYAEEFKLIASAPGKEGL
ncbi:hypothetical protein ACM7KZ_29045 [Pseudomonas aeruginosa]